MKTNSPTKTLREIGKRGTTPFFGASVVISAPFSVAATFRDRDRADHTREQSSTICLVFPQLLSTSLDYTMISCATTTSNKNLIFISFPVRYRCIINAGGALFIMAGCHAHFIQRHRSHFGPANSTRVSFDFLPRNEGIYGVTSRIRAYFPANPENWGSFTTTLLCCLPPSSLAPSNSQHVALIVGSWFKFTFEA